MLLTVSIGSASVSFGVFDGTRLVRHGRVALAEMNALADRIGTERCQRIAIVSVAPSRTDQVVSSLAQSLGAPVLRMGRDLHFGADIQSDAPDEVGADRLLNAVAAHARTGGQTIVADVGTAITVDVVSARGSFCGGAMAPGPEMMLRSLHEQTELLPAVTLQYTPAVIGHGPADAIRSGVYWGSVGMVEGLIARMAAAAAGACRILLTGEHGESIASEIKIPHEYVPALTLEGLALLASNVY